jgi:hypothetical protein
MRRVFCALMLAVGLCCPAGGQDPVYDGPVYFADAQLKEVVERDLWTWDPTPADMLGLTSLKATMGEISDLTGLEYATNLTELELHFNHISDISPLAGLTELRRLVINNNLIDDISALAGLTNLRHLDVHDNLISDISVLSGLTKLQTLVIRLNALGDLSPLAALTDLEDLDAHMTDVSDVSPLAGLTSLKRLILQFNHISDLSGLAGLTELRELNLRYNRISDVSPLAGLSDLEDLNLLSNEIRDIAPLTTMTSLKRLNLEGNPNLEQEAYRHHLYTIVDNGTSVQYSAHTRVPTGVVVKDYTSQGWIEVNWNEVCQGPLYDVYYRVYRSIPPDDLKTPVSEWQTSLSFSDTSIEPGVSYAYWVRTATSSQGDDASDYGGPGDASGSHGPVLMLSSTAGGSVTVPGEGTFPVNGRTITVTATPIDSSLFFFAGWTGSAVDAGQVSHPAQSSTLVTVDSDSTLRAHFMSFMDVLYVDDDASHGPQENGTALHPFDRIQEAIEAASKGATIVVRPGIYRENIDLLGKNVHLTGLDPNGSPLPIIEGLASGPVVSFTRGEDPNCTLTGLVITSGKSRQTGAIACVGSSPTLTNCLIVGNRATDGNGAAIHCQNSQARFVNCTIADNVGDPQGAAIVLVNSPVTMSNSIVWDNTPSQIVLRGDSGPSIVYSSVAGGWPDAGNLEAEPLFAYPGYWADPDYLKTQVDPSRPDAVWVGGDYHLKSRTGRWDPQIRAWVQDSVTSPCIDAGDPAAPVGDEPPPHGHIINLGAYGGTNQASKG